MKTILEIQKLDRKIKALERDFEKCPANVSFSNYKKFMRDGKEIIDKLEKQASEIIKQYNRALAKLEKCKGESEIINKRNVATLSLENANALIGDVNSLVGDLSEENRRVEELVRRADEINRKNLEVSAKLAQARSTADTIKMQIAKKKQEIDPQIEAVKQEIAKLEVNVQDKEKYKQYVEMKEKGIFPVYVNNVGEFCGGCSQNLSLNFMDKLKVQKMLACEHCGRIIIFK